MGLETLGDPCWLLFWGFLSHSPLSSGIRAESAGKLNCPPPAGQLHAFLSPPAPECSSCRLETVRTTACPFLISKESFPIRSQASTFRVPLAHLYPFLLIADLKKKKKKKKKPTVSRARSAASTPVPRLLEAADSCSGIRLPRPAPDSSGAADPTPGSCPPPPRRRPRG